MSYSINAVINKISNIAQEWGDDGAHWDVSAHDAFTEHNIALFKEIMLDKISTKDFNYARSLLTEDALFSLFASEYIYGFEIEKDRLTRGEQTGVYDEHRWENDLDHSAYLASYEEE